MRAVDDLSFEVKSGIVTGFLGPNGAGKSTTMRMIMGLDTPTSGRALINGVAYGELKHPMREVGALLDAKSVHPNRSAYAHLRWMAQAAGIAKSRVDEVLGIVGLSDVAGRKAGSFSLGMGQRLGLAGALLGDPHTLLLDEPVNGLDPEGIHWVRTMVRTLAAEGRAVLVSSHLLSEMSQTADQLVVIGRGKLIADAPTETFITGSSQSVVHVRAQELDALAAGLAEENMEFTRGVDSMQRPYLEVSDTTSDKVGLLAYSLGVGVTELSMKTASLEEAFLASTSEARQYISDMPVSQAEEEEKN